ncbi:uncharacterized protein G2W53_008358 [Senna tora]|uniref:Uncharacterized protein n=1 Tax=Senna tora TaxID=362788 RepID=A0A835CEJ9_9FABA|nr:uncharacterized protein G2W53_008358 [Senna tora]
MHLNRDTKQGYNHDSRESTSAPDSDPLPNARLDQPASELSRPPSLGVAQGLRQHHTPGDISLNNDPSDLGNLNFSSPNSNTYKVPHLPPQQGYPYGAIPYQPWPTGRTPYSSFKAMPTHPAQSPWQGMDFAAKECQPRDGKIVSLSGATDDHVDGGAMGIFFSNEGDGPFK